MLISRVNSENLSRQQITRFIFDDMIDDGKNGDCILVFGSKSMNRVKKAADLFFKNRAPSILLTGSGIRWGENEVPEAIWMKEHLINRGVPEEKLILEVESTNTAENVLASTFILQKKIGLNKINRILVVSSPCHMKRCSLTLKTYMPQWIEYTYCPDERPFGQKDNWWEESVEEKRVLKEVKSIIRYVNEGSLHDQVINI